MISECRQYLTQYKNDRNLYSARNFIDWDNFRKKWTFLLRKPLSKLLTGTNSKKPAILNVCRQTRGKVGKHTFIDEYYALKAKILFTKLGSVIFTFN